MQKNIQIFDVVILNNGNKAIILGKENNTYLTEIVNKKGERISVENITIEQIKEVIYRHK